MISKERIGVMVCTAGDGSKFPLSIIVKTEKTPVSN